MPKIMLNGHEVYLHDEVLTGEEIKNSAGLPEDRSLILQRPDGNRLVHNKQTVRLIEGDYFADAPTFQYGAQ